MKNRSEPDLDFAGRVKKIIRKIPRGRVATYGQIAFLAGCPASTRQVVWILHSCSKKDRLPWHRVVNARGTISLKPGAGYEKQKQLLEGEGIRFDKKDRINLDPFLWDPENGIDDRFPSIGF